MADRQASLAQQQNSTAGGGQNALWDGLDLLGSSSNQASSSSGNVKQSDDDWAFDFGTSNTTAQVAQPQAKAARESSDLFDFLSDPSPIKTQPPPAHVIPTSLLNDPEFPDLTDNNTMDEPGDFDFGDRISRTGRDSYGSDGEGDEILGILGSSKGEVSQNVTVRMVRLAYYVLAILILFVKDHVPSYL